MNLAIIGASGNVGRKTIEILEKSNIQISNLFLVASEKSEGKKIKFKGKEIPFVSSVEAVEENLVKKKSIDCSDVDTIFTFLMKLF